MKNDDQVKATIAMKKNFVVNTGWEIICEDEEIKEFVTDTLNKINEDSPMEPSFNDILEDMLSSYVYGFSLSEPIFELNKDSLYIYKAIKTRPPHTFKFDLDEFGNVKEVIQMTMKGDLKFKPDMFLHHVYQPEFGNPYGLSDLSAAFQDWKAKKFVKRFMAIYLERFASPTVVGKYKPNMQDDEVARFRVLLESIQNNTTLIIPEDAQMDMIQNAKDSSDSYMKALYYFNTCIARAILVPDLLGVSGGKTEGGSYTLGVQQFEVFMGTIDKDRRSLAKKVTNKIVQPLVRINFGEETSCHFQFIPFTGAKVMEYAKLWIQAVGGKAWEPNDEEINYLRKITGFPEGEVNRPEPAPAPGLPGSGGGNPQDRDPKRPEQSDNKIGAPTVYVPVGRDGRRLNVSAFRSLTAYEQKVNFEDIKALLDSEEAKGIRSLTDAAKDIYSDLISQIRDKGLLKRFNPERIESIKPKFLKPMNSIFSGYLQDIFGESYEQARDELVRVGPKKFEQSLVPDDFIKIIEAESFKLVGDYATDVTKRAKNTLMDAIKNGVTEGEIVKLLRDELSENTDKWIRTVVRTKTTEFYNSARRSYWENDSIAKQLVEAYQFSAIMDERTSEICKHLDQKIFSLDSDVSRVTPPLHFNCRSLLVPLTKFEEFETEKIPSLESIQDKGGNLKRFLAEEIYTYEGISNEAGDHNILPAMPGRRYEILEFSVTNSGNDIDTEFAFRTTPGGSVFWLDKVIARGGRSHKNFRPENWSLNPNNGLFFWSSSNSRLIYNCRYLIRIA